MANKQNTFDFIKSHAVKVILNPVLNYPWSKHEFSILVKTGEMNNTQPETTTHHVMYLVIYFKTYDSVINSIKERFDQPDFET